MLLVLGAILWLTSPGTALTMNPALVPTHHPHGSTERVLRVFVNLGGGPGDPLPLPVFATMMSATLGTALMMSPIPSGRWLKVSRR